MMWPKKDDDPIKEYALDARIGSTVLLDTSHLLVAEGINFSKELPMDYNVVALSTFDIDGLLINDIHIYNDENDIELIIRVFDKNEIVIYNQIDQEFPGEWDIWLDPKFGKFNVETLNIHDTDYDKQWVVRDKFIVSYSTIEDCTSNITENTFEVTNCSLFSREIYGIGYEYIYITNEEGEINTYMGIDFNKNAITVN